MATLHMTEAEVARDLPGVLEKVSQGVEVAIERDHRVVAVIHKPKTPGRNIMESIAIAEARGCTATLDQGFMKDVEEGIKERSVPWNPPEWD